MLNNLCGIAKLGVMPRGESDVWRLAARQLLDNSHRGVNFDLPRGEKNGEVKFWRWGEEGGIVERISEIDRANGVWRYVDWGKRPNWRIEDYDGDDGDGGEKEPRPRGSSGRRAPRPKVFVLPAGRGRSTPLSFALFPLLLAVLTVRLLGGMSGIFGVIPGKEIWGASGMVNWSMANWY